MQETGLEKGVARLLFAGAGVGVLLDHRRVAAVVTAVGTSVARHRSVSRSLTWRDDIHKSIGRESMTSSRNDVAPSNFAVVLALSVLCAYGCGSEAPGASAERVASVRSAVTGGGENDFFVLATTNNPEREAAFAIANANRLALGLPHIGAGYGDGPTPPSCANDCGEIATCIEQNICGVPCPEPNDPGSCATPSITTSAGCFCVVSDGNTTPAGCMWTSVGPTNIPGRVTSLAVDPTDSHNLYAATVGGLWRSITNGRRWENVSRDLLAQTAGAIAVNPGNPAEILAGYGDPNMIADSANTLFLSSSHGKAGSWVDVTPPELDNQVIFKIIYNPTPPNDVYLGTSLGVFAGTHSGSTITFSRLASFDARVSDIAVDFSASPPIVYAGVYFPSTTFGKGVWAYDGTSWTSRSTGIDTVNSDRIALGLSPSASKTIYARVARADTGHLLAIYKTITAGVQMGTSNGWSVDPGSSVLVDDDAQFNHRDGTGYAGYVNVITVRPKDQPTDPDIVFAGGQNLFERTASGWAPAMVGTDGITVGPHFDQHAIVFDPSNPNIVYLGNDGGVMMSTDMSVPWHWTTRAHGMTTTQFYDTATQQTMSSSVAGGTQDNGTNVTFGNHTWFPVLGGDGFGGVALDAVDLTLYGIVTDNPIASAFTCDVPYSTCGHAVVPYLLPPSTSIFNLPPVIATDPTLPGVAIAEGTSTQQTTAIQVLLQTTPTTDGLIHWDQILAPSDGADFRTLAISSTNDATSGQKVYYAGLGTGAIYASTDGGHNWNLSPPLTSPPHIPVAIAIDAHDSSRAFVGINSGVFPDQQVFVTTSSGSTWTAITSSGATALPLLSTRGLVIDPNDPNVLYLANQIGIFKGTLSGTTAAWIPFDEGLPAGIDLSSLQSTNVLSINPATGILTLGTFGLGEFQRDISPDASCRSTFLVTRDNVLDRGKPTQPVPDPEHPSADQARPGFFVPGPDVQWWESDDIRIDVPSFAGDPGHTISDDPDHTIAVADNFEFESCPTEVKNCPAGVMIDRNPVRGQLANAYVQVENRGITPASNVRVITLVADASTHVPLLPSNFWSDTFIPHMSGCGPLDPSSEWHVVGCATIPNINPEVPEVAQFPWNVPQPAAEHSCMLTIIDSLDDPITSETSMLDPADLVPASRHVAQRNLHIIDAPGGSGGRITIKGTPFHGLTSVKVPNRSKVSGVDVIFSRAEMEKDARLAFLLPKGTSGGATGLPPQCGATSSTTSGGTTIRLPLPSSLTFTDVTLGASDMLTLAPFVNVSDPSIGFGVLASTGGKTTNFGANAQTGNLWSQGPVFLSSNAVVHGFVDTAASLSEQNGARVTGAVTTSDTLTPFAIESWATGVPGPSQGDRILQPSQSSTIAPGTYGQVIVYSRATATFTAGTYFISNLDIEPQATVKLDQSAGPVLFYVSSAFTYRGAFVDATTGAPADAFIGYTGTGTVSLEAPLQGTVVAPNGTLILQTVTSPGVYRGTFYAKDLQVAANVSVIHEVPSSFFAVDACAALTPDEQTKAQSLGLDPTLYGVPSKDITVHLPIPAGQTFTVGLRYESGHGVPDTGARFKILEKESGKLVGGNTFVLRF
jgi:hypothetical protein